MTYQYKGPEFETDVIRRFGELDNRIIDLIVPMQNVTRLIKSSDIGKIAETLTDLSHVMKDVCQDTINQMRLQMDELKKSLNEIDIGQAFSEIKYLGSRLKEIENSIKSIKDDGIKRKVICKFNIEGFDEDIEMKKESQNDVCFSKLLNTLQEGEKKCLVMRIGWPDGAILTYSKMATKMHMSRERVRQLYMRSLRKCRHPSRKDLIEALDKEKFEYLLREIGI